MIYLCSVIEIKSYLMSSGNWRLYITGSRRWVRWDKQMHRSIGTPVAQWSRWSEGFIGWIFQPANHVW